MRYYSGRLALMNALDGITEVPSTIRFRRRSSAPMSVHFNPLYLMFNACPPPIPRRCVTLHHYSSFTIISCTHKVLASCAVILTASFSIKVQIHQYRAARNAATHTGIHLISMITRCEDIPCQKMKNKVVISQELIPHSV